MKATGIVRRIDDLGRVVIPKEIRRTLRIREGDPLEIYTEKDGEVIFKKYSPMGELGEFAVSLCETLGKTGGLLTAIADRDSIIAVHGIPKRELLTRPVSASLEKIMDDRRIYCRRAGDRDIIITDGMDKYSVTTAAPILSRGDVLGCVIFFSESGAGSTETEQKLAQTAAAFLGRQMEE